MAWSRLLVLVALGSGIVWLLVRTAVFENRPHAALEARAVWHAVLDTWPGLVWLARHGLLIVLGAFLAIRADVTERRNWIAARGEALVLAALALALVSGSSHAAAISPSRRCRPWRSTSRIFWGPASGSAPSSPSRSCCARPAVKTAPTPAPMRCARLAASPAPR